MDEADKFIAESDFIKELNTIMEDTDIQTEKNADSTPEAIALRLIFPRLILQHTLSNLRTIYWLKQMLRM